MEASISNPGLFGLGLGRGGLGWLFPCFNGGLLRGLHGAAAFEDDSVGDAYSGRSDIALKVGLGGDFDAFRGCYVAFDGASDDDLGGFEVSFDDSVFMDEYGVVADDFAGDVSFDANGALASDLACNFGFRADYGDRFGFAETFFLLF
jgi:hypothetical protein